MATTRLYMSMSLDGFIAGPNESPDNALGDGGGRLHEWVFPKVEPGDMQGALKTLTGVNKTVFEEAMATGAVVAGRGTFEPAKGWNGDHHDGVPIWILSRHPAPAWAAKWPNVHYVSDLKEAMDAARAAAGDKAVLVHGASVGPWAIAQGLLDAVEIHLVPILFGAGRPLFATLGVGLRVLERVRILEGEAGMVHLRYRVRK